MTSGRARSWRSRCRRASMVAVAGVALLAPASAAAAPVAPVAPPAIEAFDVSDFTRSLADAPDGGVWSVEWLVGGRDAYSAVRFAPDGARHEVPLVSGAGGLNRVLSDFAPLSDGRIGLVVGRSRGVGDASHVYEVALARLARTADRPQLVPLPQPARRGSGFAIAGDGTVWFGRSCSDAIYRRTPSGQLTRFQLTRLGCRGLFDARSTMALGPDGSAWLVNLAQRRIARVGVRGRVREWRLPSWDRRREAPGVPVVSADPRGGIAFADLTSLSGIAGRIDRAGRLTALSGSSDGSFSPAFAFEPDGTLWRSAAGGLERLTPRGVSRTFPLVETPDVASLTLSRTGAPWFLAGRFEWEGGSGGYGGWYQAPVLGVADATSVLGTWRPTTAATTRHLVELRGRDQSEQTEIVLGPDGALWATVMDFTARQTRLIRALPADVGRPRKPVARVRGTLARSARAVWLQLGCAADAGRFCRGSVRLRRGGQARFAIEGRERGTVRVPLARRLRRQLTRARVVRTTAIVRSAGAGTTRRALVLRRAR